jgi:hypothetical protein
MTINQESKKAFKGLILNKKEKLIYLKKVFTKIRIKTSKI